MSHRREVANEENFHIAIYFLDIKLSHPDNNIINNDIINDNNTNKNINIETLPITSTGCR